MEQICYIIGAGDNAGTNFQKRKKDYLIAVDGGYQTAIDMDMVPDLIVGDFDSLGYIPQGDNVKAFPVEKDETDMRIAVKEAIRLGYQQIQIYGGTGGRADHTIANIQTLLYGAKKGMDIYMIDKERVYTVVAKQCLLLENRQCQNLSVFALGERAEGVTISGAKYEMKDGILYNDFPLAVSNCFIGKDVKISVKKGALLIIYDR